MNQLRCFSFYVEGGENMENELKAVDGETLWGMEFGAQLFCIKGLLPQGACILGGASKIGKSWMVLDWVDKVAKGEPVWGMETTKEQLCTCVWRTISSVCSTGSTVFQTKQWKLYPLTSRNCEISRGQTI